ncbi:MAG: metal ABC transporter substrate-binding protein [Nocardioides sp.]
MKRLRRPATLLGLGLAAPLLAACGDAGDAGGTQVVASFYPLQYVASRIAGEHADVESLASPGVEPHDLELTIQQTAAIADADVIVYSRGFQPAVDDTVDENAEGRVVEAADEAGLIRTADGQDDPHFWLDPNRLADVAVAVSRQLVREDPDSAGAYQQNLLVLKNDLDDLDADFKEGLRDCERRTVVVSHDAFGYLGARYDLDIHAINGISPDAEPSPAHLGELSDLIESEGITTVFSETLASPAMADTLASDLGLETAVLDPVEGLGDDTADEDYLSLMRANLAALQEANGCR